MADDIDWGEVGEGLLEAAITIGVTAAVNAGFNAVFGPGDKTPSMAQQYALKQSRPAAIVLVGGYSRIAGAWAFYESNGDVIDSVQALCDGRIDAVPDGVWLNDDKVAIDGAGTVTAVTNGANDGRYTDDTPRVIVTLRPGVASETAYADLIADYPALWTTDHRGDGTASVHMRCVSPRAKFFRVMFPGGRPELTVAVRGVCFDWRDGTQTRSDPATWKPSDNPVVWLVHLEWFRWGLDWDFAIAPVLSALTAQADICDAAVTLAAGGTEPRYRVAGSYRDTEDRDSIRQKILATMDGYRSIDSRGRLVVMAGHYAAPGVTLTADSILACDWRQGIPQAQAVAMLNVSFVSPAADYQQVECDPWIIDPDGVETADFFVEWCPSFSQARRLAKREASRLSVQASGTLTVDDWGLLCWGERYVRVQNPVSPDMADIVVELPEGGEFSDAEGFTYPARLADPNIDAWNPATEEGTDPGAPERATGEALPQPVITSVGSFLEDASTAGNSLRLSISATGPARSDLTWFWRWRVQGRTAWAEGTDTDATGSSVTLESDFVPVAALIEVQVSYSTGNGRFSPWSETASHNTVVFSMDFRDPLNSQYFPVTLM